MNNRFIRPNSGSVVMLYAVYDEESFIRLLNGLREKGLAIPDRRGSYHFERGVYVSVNGNKVDMSYNFDDVVNPKDSMIIQDYFNRTLYNVELEFSNVFTKQYLAYDKHYKVFTFIDNPDYKGSRYKTAFYSDEYRNALKGIDVNYKPIPIEDREDCRSIEEFENRSNKSCLENFSHKFVRELYK